MIFCLDLINLYPPTFYINNPPLISSIPALPFGVFINKLLHLLNLFCNKCNFTLLLFGLFLNSFLLRIYWSTPPLLVGFYATRTYTIRVVLKTFVFSRIGNMLILFLLTNVVFDTTNHSVIFLRALFRTYHFLS